MSLALQTAAGVELLEPPKGDDSLAEARRTLRADPRWASPYYWAGFTFNGDWK